MMKAVAASVFVMSSFKGFGKQSSSIGARRNSTKIDRHQWQNLPLVEPSEQIALWEAGLLHLQLPPSFQPRSLTASEQHWLDRAVQAAYLNPENNGQAALFYTAPPPEFRLAAAEWYLHPDYYWNHPPVLLSWAMQQFPADSFQFSATGQAPGFYPDRTPQYSLSQEAIMRQIFRETVRLGWSLPDYKWFVMRSLHKTTAQVTETEAHQLLQALQANAGDQESPPT